MCRRQRLVVAVLLCIAVNTHHTSAAVAKISQWLSAAWEALGARSDESTLDDEDDPVPVYEPPVRGVAPEAAARFAAAKDAGHFDCNEGPRLPFARVNDNFCDCR